MAADTTVTHRPDVYIEAARSRELQAGNKSDTFQPKKDSLAVVRHLEKSFLGVVLALVYVVMAW